MIEYVLFSPGTVMIGWYVDDKCISIFLGLFGIDIHRE